MNEEAGEYKTRPPERGMDEIRQEVQADINKDLIKHQAEAWCQILTDLVCNHGLDYKEPGELAVDQVRSFLKRKLVDEPKAAQRLCELYFNIAAEAVGEDEVRRRRDAALTKLERN